MATTAAVSGFLGCSAPGIAGHSCRLLDVARFVVGLNSLIPSNSITECTARFSTCCDFLAVSRECAERPTLKAGKRPDTPDTRKMGHRYSACGGLGDGVVGLLLQLRPPVYSKTNKPPTHG